MRGSHVTRWELDAERSAGTVSISASDYPAGAHLVEGAGTTTLTEPEPNIDADPLFVDALAGNYELSDGSPAIDASYSPPLAPDESSTDLLAPRASRTATATGSRRATWARSSTPRCHRRRPPARPRPRRSRPSPARPSRVPVTGGPGVTSVAPAAPPRACRRAPHVWRPQRARSVPEDPWSMMRRHRPAMVAPASAGSSPAGRMFEMHLRSASVLCGPGCSVT